VPRRTLERAFRDVLGVSPAAYLRIRALNAVRRALLDAEPRSGAIARLAFDGGFWHLGRFAQSYRALFGKRPVDTLRSRAKSS
jgi:AraC family ethanolamine operon transcriptional activator